MYLFKKHNYAKKNLILKLNFIKMKNNFALLLFLVTSFVFGQGKYIETMTYDQSQDINFFINIKNNTKVGEYTTQSGNSIKLGDTLILGKPTNESSSSFGGSYGRDGRVGGFSTKTRKEFQYIQMGRPSGFGAVMGAMGDSGTQMAGIQFSGERVVVSEIKTYHQGSKKKPLNVVLVIGEINGRAFGINKYLSAMDTENAIELGELLLKNRKMTREEAIAKLKESKDLLDLEMMSQEEYDALRKELAPIIRGN